MTNNAESSRIEGWVVRNSGWLALGMVTVAFAIRITYAASCYLNIDEAVHFNAARPSSWFAAFEASRRLWHPPLFILVLHGMLYFGRSELILRLPSLIAGTAALWFAFAWMRRSLGEIPALAGLGFMTVSSAAISASTEVRQYGLLLFFICAALYATERAFAERSLKWAICQGFMLLGALLTHYIAVLVLATLGLYVLLRSVLDAVPRRILWTFVATQFVLAGVLGWLYFSQVRKLVPFGAGTQSYLSTDYYRAGHESLLAFTWRAFHGTFAYATASRSLAVPLMLVFLAGMAALWVGRIKAPRLTWLLVISPFVIGFAAAVAQVFPFTGSRHEAYLLPFFAAGFSAALAWLPRRRTVMVLLLLAVIAPPVLLVGTTPDNNPRKMAKSDMTAAIQFVHKTLPKGSLLFVDRDTRDVLRYYLGRNDKNLDVWSRELSADERVGDYRLIVASTRLPGFKPYQALGKVADSARRIGVPPSEPLWIFSVRWVWSPALASQLPTSSYGHVESREFGNISVIRLSDWSGLKTPLDHLRVSLENTNDPNFLTAFLVSDQRDR